MAPARVRIKEPGDAKRGKRAVDLSQRKELPLFPIGIVQKLTGLSARQIRYYEQHGLVHPARSEGKQRLFSFADVERLMEVRRLLDEGLNMSGVKERLGREGKLRVHDTSENASELSDEALLRHLQQELLEGAPSLLQGELSRFYRRRM
jgi:MerR family glutamine synthetase transcriptional repressor